MATVSEGGGGWLRSASCHCELIRRGHDEPHELVHKPNKLQPNFLEGQEAGAPNPPPPMEPHLCACSSSTDPAEHAAPPSPPPPPGWPLRESGKVFSCRSTCSHGLTLCFKGPFLERLCACARACTWHRFPVCSLVLSLARSPAGLAHSVCLSSPATGPAWSSSAGQI